MFKYNATEHLSFITIGSVVILNVTKQYLKAFNEIYFQMCINIKLDSLAN